MPTAKKLPSGSWRCQVFSHYEYVKQNDGTIKKKRVYESFTCDDPSKQGKKKAEAMAAEFSMNKERMERRFAHAQGFQGLDLCGEAGEPSLQSG